MPPNKSGSKTEQIKEHIRDSVRQSALQPSQQLPSLKEIAATEGVSLSTVAAAMRELQIEGVIRGARGKGNFVAERGALRKHLRVQWMPNMPPLAIDRITRRFRDAYPHMDLVITENDPDLVPVDLALLPRMQDELQDITHKVLELYDRREEGKEQFNALRCNDRLFFVPLDWRVGAIALNLDMLERAGVPAPDADWDHAALLQMAERLTRPDLSQFGFAFGNEKNIDFFLGLVYQNGGRIFDPIGMRCLLAEVESLEAARFVRRLSALAPGEELLQLPPLSPAFVQGRAAMMFATSWEYLPLKRQCKFRLGFVPLPRGRVHGCCLSADGYALRRGAPLDGAAGAFLQLVAEIEKWPEYIDGHPAIPLHRSLEPDVDAEAFRVFSAALGYARTFLDDIEPTQRSLQHALAYNLVVFSWKQIIAGDAAVEDILRTLRDHINNLLPLPHGALFNSK